jgi:tetratricopeptide (TPR) repeat protein
LRRAAPLLLLAALVASCGAPPQAPFREGEDYVYPEARGGEASSDEVGRLKSAWRLVLQGRGPDAEREYGRILQDHPGLLPAQTGLAYARLRSGRPREAASGFDAVLSQRPDSFAALIGGASAAMRLADPEQALTLYGRALEVRPDDPTAGRRLQEAKLQATERAVASGRAAVAAGRPDEATDEFRKALGWAPELAGLRMDLADLLATRGDLPGALAVLSADPTGDRQVLLRLADLQVQGRDFSAALESYRRLLERDPADAEARRRALETREALELEGMPEEYRRIPDAEQITRADLAALVSAKVASLGRVPGAEPPVAIDISGSWARAYILRALSLDLIGLYPNHTFQPSATVRRGDLARAVARVLDLLGRPASAAPEMSDMTRNNVYYEAARRAVAAGLMDLTSTGAFQPWRPVSGREATDVLEALNRLAGP